MESTDQLALVRELRSQNRELDSEIRRLKSADGGGTLPPMETVDAKIAAAEARTDAKFAELRGGLSSDFADLKAEIKTELASKPGTATLIGTLAATAALILGALAYGGDRLQMGIGLADQRQAQLQRDNEQDRKFDEILKRLPPAQNETIAPRK